LCVMEARRDLNPVLQGAQQKQEGGFPPS
jgi:hypothetical protein